MNHDNLKKRTKLFALDVIKLVENLPSSRTCNILGNQLLRAGTSVGANYRAACRAKSTADFISKMGTVEEECDESLFWMDLLIESRRMKADRLCELQREGSELLAMTVASIKTARNHKSLRQASSS
jgi:four helix bundle protein